MKALAIIFLFAVSGVMLAQVILIPVKRDALFMTSRTNVLRMSNAVQIISGLKSGMALTNVDRYMNAHGMTNRGGLSLDRGQHSNFYYDFPGTDSTLVLETRSSRTRLNMFDWEHPALQSGRIQRLGVDTFLITFTNAP